MKKILFIGLAAAALLTGCNQDETLEMANNKGAITFSPFVGKSTRSLIINQTNLPECFVYGWRTGTDGQEQVVFNGQRLNGNGSYDNFKYWEKDNTYQFEAIYPEPIVANGIEMTPKSEGGEIKYTNDGSRDLIYARPDEMVITAITTNMPTVKLNFVHLLSKVKFQVKNEFPQNSPVRIVVKKVQIKNCYSSATITPGTVTGKTVAGSWSNYGTQNLTIEYDKLISTNNSDNGEALNTKIIKPSNTDFLESESKFLIPGIGERTIYVEFEVRQLVDASNEDGEYTVKSYTREVTYNFDLQQGNAYTLVCRMGNNTVDPNNPMVPIEFTIGVTTWEEQDPKNVTTDENNQENN